MTESTMQLIIDFVTDISFCIACPLFFSSVLSMRFGKLKCRILFPIIFMAVSPWMYFFELPQYAMFFTGIFLMLALVFVFSNDKPAKKILFTFIPYAANIITTMLYFFVRSLIMPDFEIVFGTAGWIYTIYCILGYSIPMYFIAKLLNRKKPDVSSLTVIYILSMFVVQMVILTFIMYVRSTDMSTPVYMSILMVYMIAVIALSLFIFRYSVRISREQARREMAANLYDQLSAQYAQLRSSYVGYRKLRHDLKDHIRVIDGLAARGNTSELSEYTRKLTADWDKLSSKTFCDVPAVDIVLAEKYSLASDSGINADFLVSGIAESGADPIYLCSIFSNLLNNAFEAACACSSNEPYIKLRAAVKLGRLTITCVNSMPGTVTEKQDPDEHGYGLHIIKELAALLGGSFTYTHDGKAFTAGVSIPVKEAK